MHKVDVIEILRFALDDNLLFQSQKYDDKSRKSKKYFVYLQPEVSLNPSNTQKTIKNR